MEKHSKKKQWEMVKMVVEKIVKNFPRKKKDKNGNVEKTYDVLRIDLKKKDELSEGEEVYILNQEEFQEYQNLKNSDGSSLLQKEEEIQSLKKQLENSMEQIEKQNNENLIHELQQLKEEIETKFETIENKNNEIIQLNKEIEKLKNNNKHILTIFKHHILSVDGFTFLQRIKSSTFKNLNKEVKKQLEFYDSTLFLEGNDKTITMKDSEE